MIVKGTPEHLIRCLVGAGGGVHRDPDYAIDFLMTYRTFTTSLALAQALLAACKVRIGQRVMGFLLFFFFVPCSPGLAFVSKIFDSYFSPLLPLILA